MPHPCIGFEIGLGHICWYFRAYICSKILKVLHPCIGFGIGLGHIWGHANAWIWYIHAYAWILYIHVLSHISHIPKAEIFGFMFQYLSSERMGLRFWANPIHNTWLDHGEISRTRCTPFCPVMSLSKRKILKDPAYTFLDYAWIMSVSVQCQGFASLSIFDNCDSVFSVLTRF